MTKNIQNLVEVSFTLANEEAAVEAVFGSDFAAVLAKQVRFCLSVCDAFLEANDLFEGRQQLRLLEYADKLVLALRLLNVEIGDEAFLRRIREGNANLTELEEESDARFNQIKKSLQAAMAYRASF